MEMSRLQFSLLIILGLGKAICGSIWKKLYGIVLSLSLTKLYFSRLALTLKISYWINSWTTLLGTTIMLLIFIIVIILVSFFLSWNREDLDGSSLEPFKKENILGKNQNTVLPSQVSSRLNNCFPELNVISFLIIF